ncbi:MAG TPA: phage head-tail connector protein [Allosphingosinicella sp.]|nr:phage head-tail connector protein [Allosphingosinicella sp.]
MIVIEEPPAPPVTLAEMKAFLRIGSGEEDALLATLARSAGEMCERFTGRSLLARDVTETLPASTAWTRLGAAPVRGIDGVEAVDAAGGAAALPADAYAIDIDAAGDGWVRVLRAAGAKQVRVAYSAGMAAEIETLPEALRHGVVRLAAHLYTHRDRHDGAGPPAAVTALWRPWRRLRLR